MQLVLERCTIRPWRLDDADSLREAGEQSQSLARVAQSLPASVHDSERAPILAASDKRPVHNEILH